MRLLRTVVRKAVPYGAVGLVLALHLVLLQEHLPWSAAMSDQPIAGDDYDTHLGQTYRLLGALRSAGKHWAYAPTLLAGFPAGAIFDADNKGWAYFTYGVSGLFGVSPARAHNLFVYLAGLLPPFLGMLGAFLFRLGFAPMVLSGMLFSCLFFFDSFTHWCYYVGMVAYTAASMVAVVPLGLLYRFVSERRFHYGLWCALILAVAHTLHPYTFFIVALPMVVMVVRARRALGWAGWGMVGGIVATTVAVNAPWLHASLIHWPYILDSGYFALGGLRIFFADMFNLLVSPIDTGVIGTRVSLRFAAAILTLGTLVSWYRSNDERLWSLGLAAAFVFALGYLGAYVPGLEQIQPYRHVVPAGFLMALPASWLVVEALRSPAVRLLPLPGKVLGLCLLFLSSQQFVEHAFYLLPHRMPALDPLLDGTEVPYDASGNSPRVPLILPHASYFHQGVAELNNWAHRYVGTRGRVVVEEFALGERMGWDGQVDVIGGFRLRNLVHAYSNILRLQQGRVISEAQLRDYVQTYGVTHLIMYSEHPEFDRMPGLLEPLGRHYYRRLYRVRSPTTKIAGSGGTVIPSLNRLQVQGTAGQSDLVLRYHYHPALRCRPHCQLRREPIAGPDPVGFIRVPAPHPSDFEIYNGY